MRPLEKPSRATDLVLTFKGRSDLPLFFCFGWHRCVQVLSMRHRMHRRTRADGAN